MKELFVWRGAMLVGYLVEANDGSVGFRYDQSWLNRHTAESLCQDMPLEDKIFPENVCKPFFSNLLPEGHSRLILEKAFHISSTFGFLKMFGEDLAGGYSITSTHELKPGSYVPITKERLKKLLVGKNSGAVTFIRNYPAYRLSLAGGQEKIALRINASGEFFVPVEGAASTHIIKPDLYGDPNIERTSLNEAFVMTTLKNMNLDVAEVSFSNELSSIIVKRFDRKESGGFIGRLPTLDLCQVLGLPPENKYEPELTAGAGPKIRDIGNVLRLHSRVPAKNIRIVAEGMIAAALVGDMDHHAKNISFYFNGGRLEATPLYDISNTLAYRNLKKELAFSLGGTRNPESLDKDSWTKFGKDIGLGREQVLQIVRGLISKVEPAMEKTINDPQFSDLSTGQKTFIYRRIVDNIQERTRRWQRVCGLDSYDKNRTENHGPR
ncbi:MAG: HipA domain-containing protein [Leptospirales bacterium]